MKKWFKRNDTPLSPGFHKLKPLLSFEHMLFQAILKWAHLEICLIFKISLINNYKKLSDPILLLKISSKY